MNVAKGTMGLLNFLIIDTRVVNVVYDLAKGDTIRKRSFKIINENILDIERIYPKTIYSFFMFAFINVYPIDLILIIFLEKFQNNISKNTLISVDNILVSYLSLYPHCLNCFYNISCPLYIVTRQSNQGTWKQPP